MDNTSVYNESEVNFDLSGSFFADGTQFSPRVSKDDTLYAYSPEICRYGLHWR